MSEVNDPEALAGLRADFTLRRGVFRLRAELSAPPGLTALLGPSGAGKSLTLQVIAGLASIERGTITLNDRTLADASAGIALPPQLRRVGYVPQSYALFPHMTVAANIAYGAPTRLDRHARDKRVATLLDLVHLPGYETRSPHNLSGGEAQRVALARALAAEPDALLLDEPFSALDALTRNAVRTDLRDIALASGLPTLLVTHDLSEALALASRLVLVARGRIQAHGTVADVTERPDTMLAARLLGWGGVIAVTQWAREREGVSVTLACGQTLRLPDGACAQTAKATKATNAWLALRLERLIVSTNADAEPANALRVLRGVVRSVTQAGPFWNAQVALDGAAPTDAALDLPFSAREWPTMGLTPGVSVTLAIPEDAARLVAADTEVEEAAQ
ncbi:MAG TPA: ABC transporter ATP-binding protein [Ktedonobacterales bacterium]